MSAYAHFLPIFAIWPISFYQFFSLLSDLFLRIYLPFLFSAAWQISSRHSDHGACLQRTGRVSITAASAAKDLRGRPEVFLYRSEKASGRTYALTLLGPAVPSALHLLAEEARHGLRELALRLAGRVVAVGGPPPPPPHPHPHREGWGGPGDGQKQGGVVKDDRHRTRALVTAQGRACS